MSIMILCRYPSQFLNFKDWFKNCDENIFLFVNKKYEKDYKKLNFATVVGFKNYDYDASIELEAIKLSKENKITNIFAFEERDILRAGRLRDFLHIKGQDYQSSLAYRNKLVMKTILSTNGITVPAFSKADTIYDILRFIEVHGYPILIKPVDKYAAIDTRKIENWNELVDYCSEINIENMMVEEFIDSDMGSCNGMVIDNKIEFVASTIYLLPRLQFNRYLVAITLPPHDHRAKKMEVYCREVIKTLPPMQTSVFHSELFLSENSIKLCEIASRIPGGGITDAIKYSYNIDLNEQWAKIIVNKNYSFPHVKFNKYSASIIVPKRKGKIKRIAASLPYDWVENYFLSVKEGDIIEDSQKNGDKVALIIITSDTYPEIIDRITQITNYFEKHLIIEKPEN